MKYPAAADCHNWQDPNEQAGQEQQPGHLLRVLAEYELKVGHIEQLADGDAAAQQAHQADS